VEVYATAVVGTTAVVLIIMVMNVVVVQKVRTIVAHVTAVSVIVLTPLAMYGMVCFHATVIAMGVVVTHVMKIIVD